MDTWTCECQRGVPRDPDDWMKAPHTFLLNISYISFLSSWYGGLLALTVSGALNGPLALAKHYSLIILFTLVCVYCVCKYKYKYK